MDDAKKQLSPPQWLGRPIVDVGHVQDLETRAAMNEFGHKMPRHEAEQRAHDDYVRDQRERAAAHHLAGLRAAQATGNHQDAKKHWALYDMHLKALGKESIGPVPPEIEKRMMEETGSKPLYRFKAHKGDLYALHEPSKDQAPPQGEPIQKGNFDGPEFDRARVVVRRMNAEDQLHAGKPKFAVGQAVLPNVEAIRNATNADYTGHVGRVAQVARPNSSGHRYVVDFHGPQGTKRTEVNEEHLTPTESNVVGILKGEVIPFRSKKDRELITADMLGDAEVPNRELSPGYRDGEERVYQCDQCGHRARVWADPGKHEPFQEPCESCGKQATWKPLLSIVKAEAKQCKWRLGERRCKRMVTTGYCHDHKDHWANKIRQKESAEPMEKEELLTKPPVSEAQRRAMEAAAHGDSKIGIPKKVGEEFSNADPGGKLPEHHVEKAERAETVESVQALLKAVAELAKSKLPT